MRPGEHAGQSVGCFKAFPLGSPSLPPLQLLGRDRNIDTFDVDWDADRAASVQSTHLRLNDRNLVQAESRFRDLHLTGPGEGPEERSDTAILLAEPGPRSQTDPDRRVAARAEAAHLDLEARGTTRDCYGGVLRPYETVNVHGAGWRFSGSYRIYAVTHTLTRSAYTQAFTLRGTATREKAGTPAPSTPNPF